MSIQPIQLPAGELVNFPAAAADVVDLVVPPELADYVEDLSRMPAGLFAEEERFEKAQEVWAASQRAATDASIEPAVQTYLERVAVKARLIAAERRRRDGVIAAGGAQDLSSVCLADGKQKRVGWQ